LNNPFELPSLESIEEMDRQRLQAIESLQLSDGFVKCQKCGVAVTLFRTSTPTKPKSNRIAALKRQIKWIEEHYHHHYVHRHYGNTSNNKDNNNVKQLKQELADLLEEDAKAGKLRSLPLYSCRITGWKFVCSKCYDKVYNILV
jgi:hypothetical protein